MSFSINTKIEEFDDVAKFVETYKINSNDLIFTNDVIYQNYFKNTKGKVFLYNDYGNGEPSDELVERLYKDIKDFNYNRVIAIGGGAILDVGKILALEDISPVDNLFNGTIEVKKGCEMIAIPTTCGTGSEVTNISILALLKKNTKLGLANPCLYPDKAVLIPTLLEGLPYKVFATSSIDALIHACESFTSPNATTYSKIFSREAIKIILNAYKDIALNKDHLKNNLRDLLVASNYAGIAFSNAGCALVHAMSYPLGAKYHVAHGESNYVLFMAVYKKYLTIKSDGAIDELFAFIAEILEVEKEKAIETLESLLKNILPLKQMSAYGATWEDIEEFVQIVVTKQGRLTKNNFVSVNEREIKEIYESVF